MKSVAVLLTMCFAAVAKASDESVLMQANVQVLDQSSQAAANMIVNSVGASVKAINDDFKRFGGYDVKSVKEFGDKLARFAQETAMNKMGEQVAEQTAQQAKGKVEDALSRFRDVVDLQADHLMHGVTHKFELDEKLRWLRTVNALVDTSTSVWRNLTGSDNSAERKDTMSRLLNEIGLENQPPAVHHHITHQVDRFLREEINLLADYTYNKVKEGSSMAFTQAKETRENNMRASDGSASDAKVQARAAREHVREHTSFADHDAQVNEQGAMAKAKQDYKAKLRSEGWDLESGSRSDSEVDAQSAAATAVSTQAATQDAATAQFTFPEEHEFVGTEE